MMGRLISVSRPRRALGTAAAALLLMGGLVACEPIPPVVLNLTVTTAADGNDATPGDGVCEATSGAGDCTLRAAITESNHVAGRDVIAIAPGVNPVLSVVGAAEDANDTGDLDVLGEVAIGGSGATVDAAGLDRVFDVRSGALTIRDLRITGGQPPAKDDPGTWGSGGGSAVRSQGKLILERSTFFDNSRNSKGVVASSFSSVRMFDTEINDSVGSRLVSTEQSTLHLSRSTLTTSRYGIGIEAGAGTGLVITDSTIAGEGGALSLRSDSTTVVARSTLVSTVAGRPRLLTIDTGQPTRPNALYIGGSILDAPSSPSDPMCSSSETVTSLGWNAAADESCGLTAEGDHQGEPDLVLAIYDNGGPTQTALLVPGSPALDRIPPGTPLLCDGIPDQRGVARPLGDGCDAGAVEGVGEAVDYDVVVSFTVDTAADGVDATPGDGICATAAGSCTLRAAVMEANARRGPSRDLDHLVTIASGIDPMLSIPGADEDAAASGDLDIVKPLTIQGSGATIDGSDLDRVFDVMVASGLTVQDMTITGGAANSGENASLDGGGIRGKSLSTIVVERTTVRANTATRDGGGIHAVGGLTVTDSDIVDNSAHEGGGVESSGALLIERSLFRDNASNAGGALYTSGVDALITDSTFSGNAAETGAAIYTGGVGNARPVSLLRSTVAGNTGSALTVSAEACQPFGGCFSFYMLHAESSIIVAPAGSTACLGAFNGTAGTLGNLAPDGSCGATLPGSALLGPLVDAGGPTPAHVPAAGSAAIDAIAPGSLSTCDGAIVDQRGISRPQGSGCDVGAVEQ